MDSNIQKTSGGGLGCAGTLFLIFLVLKLVKLIDWSWIWVFSPLWICAGLFILILICYVIIAILSK